MGLECDPGAGMGVGCDQRAAIPTDRVDNKITRQMNLERRFQKNRWPDARASRVPRGGEEPAGKTCGLPRFQIMHRPELLRRRAGRARKGLKLQPSRS